jgi:miniconductance mechanosensitive channel
MIEKYKKIDILSDYIDEKIAEIKDSNSSKEVSESILNRRALTNVGTYRAYVQSYLRNNENIHKDMTFLVRQLSPGENGLPLEVYVFSKNINWIEYEAIQSDIFDHLITSVKEFDLTLFQNPTGNDFKTMRSI